MQTLFKLITVTSKLKWLLALAGVAGGLAGIAGAAWLTRAFIVLVFIEPSALQGLYQLFGNLYALVAHRFRLPSPENYVCKNDYILPFTGKWTVFNGGVTRELSHSWGIAAQRYAYDFLVVEPDGKAFDGEGKKPGDYLCYGKDIIAAADGLVVKVCNRHGDSRVHGGTNVYCDAWDIRGNHIVIDHGGGEYSLTAHVMKDSFTVKAGDKVRQGQAIAKYGNSGNSSEPHIHFQLQTGRSFCLSAGFPVAFSGVTSEESAGYRAWSKLSCEGNLQTQADGKSYIGRGLDVQTAGVESHKQIGHPPCGRMG